MASKYLYYTVGDLEDILGKISLMSMDDEEFIRTIMKVVCSFGKERLLTETGIAEGRRLFNSIKPLNRKEIMTCVFVMTELSILEDFDDRQAVKLKKYFNHMQEKYNPDDSYLKEFAHEYLMDMGFVMVNPQYIPDIQKYFMILMNEFPKFDDGF